MGAQFHEQISALKLKTEKHQKRYYDYSCKVKTLQQTLANLNEEITKLKCTANDLCERVLEAKRKQDELAGILKDLQCEAEKVRTEHDNLERQMNQEQETLKNLKEEIECLCKKKMELNCILKNKTKENCALQKQYDQLYNKVCNLKKELQAMTSEPEIIMGRINVLQQKLTCLTENNKEKESQIKVLHNEIECSQIKFNQLVDDILIKEIKATQAIVNDCECKNVKRE
ncbi:UNVERIFIED_CONTAM: hypothetical protein RMT77_007210 [Armadillidium vulgare]